MQPSILRVLLVATLLVAQLGTVAVFALDARRRAADELDTGHHVAATSGPGRPDASGRGTPGAVGESPLSVWQLLAALLAVSAIATVAILRVTAPMADTHRDATVDRLTGALLRGEFERRLALLMARRFPFDQHAFGRGEQLIVAALELDGLGAVDDTHGRGAGDEVLIELTRRLQLSLRPDDLVGRTGGEGFLLALRLPAAADPRAMLERIREAVGDAPVRGRYRVGVTAGIARQRPGESSEALLRRAERTLAEGKAFEKNRTYLALAEKPTGPATVA